MSQTITVKNHSGKGITYFRYHPDALSYMGDAKPSFTLKPGDTLILPGIVSQDGVKKGYIKIIINKDLAYEVPENYVLTKYKSIFDAQDSILKKQQSADYIYKPEFVFDKELELWFVNDIPSHPAYFRLFRSDKARLITPFLNPKQIAVLGEERIRNHSDYQYVPEEYINLYKFRSRKSSKKSKKSVKKSAKKSKKSPKKAKKSPKKSAKKAKKSIKKSVKKARK